MIINSQSLSVHVKVPLGPLLSIVPFYPNTALVCVIANGDKLGNKLPIQLIDCRKGKSIRELSTVVNIVSCRPTCSSMASYHMKAFALIMKQGKRQQYSGRTYQNRLEERPKILSASAAAAAITGGEKTKASCSTNFLPTTAPTV